MPELLEARTVRPAVLDVRQRLQQQPTDETSHSHYARGVRVDAATAGNERMHYHRTGTGVTEMAPNRRGHQHRMRTGEWTAPSVERWSSAGVRRL